MRPVVYPADWLLRPELPPLSDYGRRMLAEGDSWFTIGTLNLVAASNVLFKLDFAAATAIVTCAYPGDTFSRMVDQMRDPYFNKLLRKMNFASYWEAVLVSAGGNDLIDAAQIPPRDSKGNEIPQEKRLLLTPVEADVVASTTRRTPISQYASDRPGSNRHSRSVY